MAISLRTYFLIPWLGVTHGPHDSLHPSESAIPAFHTELVRRRNGLFERLLPIGRHVDPAPVDDHGGLHRGTEAVEAADAHPVHPFRPTPAGSLA